MCAIGTCIGEHVLNTKKEIDRLHSYQQGKFLIKKDCYISAFPRLNIFGATVNYFIKKVQFSLSLLYSEVSK